MWRACHVERSLVLHACGRAFQFGVALTVAEPLQGYGEKKKQKTIFIRSSLENAGLVTVLAVTS